MIILDASFIILSNSTIHFLRLGGGGAGGVEPDPYSPKQPAAQIYIKALQDRPTYIHYFTIYIHYINPTYNFALSQNS